MTFKTETKDDIKAAIRSCFEKLKQKNAELVYTDGEKPEVKSKKLKLEGSCREIARSRWYYAHIDVEEIGPMEPIGPLDRVMNVQCLGMELDGMHSKLAHALESGDTSKLDSETAGFTWLTDQARRLRP